jgi:hypothetical protein
MAEVLVHGCQQWSGGTVVVGVLSPSRFTTNAQSIEKSHLSCAPKRGRFSGRWNTSVYYHIFYGMGYRRVRIAEQPTKAEEVVLVHFPY